MINWYRTQTTCIKWGNMCSAYFRVSNSVILSPNVFSVYVDELSRVLSAAKTGCFIDDISVNHVFYADDLCIMAASPSDLQKLLIYVLRTADITQYSLIQLSQYVLFLSQNDLSYIVPQCFKCGAYGLCNQCNKVKSTSDLYLLLTQTQRIMLICRGK